MLTIKKETKEPEYVMSLEKEGDCVFVVCENENFGKNRVVMFSPSGNMIEIINPFFRF